MNEVEYAEKFGYLNASLSDHERERLIAELEDARRRVILGRVGRLVLAALHDQEDLCNRVKAMRREVAV